jgi:predicted HTH domain antitoxin
VLRQAGLDEQQARIEFSCWLFDTERLELWPAAQLAGLSRGDFEVELLKRRIAIYRYTDADFAHDMGAAHRLGM